MAQTATATATTLSTPRLTLRAPRADDAPLLARLANDHGVASMTTSIPYPYDEAMAESFLDRMARADRSRDAVFAIDIPDVGFAGVVELHPTRGCATELGYWLGRPHWGKGYMTEAVRAALEWAGGAWGKRFLRAGHFADNPASGQVLIKAGFLYTGDVCPRFSVARGEKAATRMMVWLA